MSPPLSNRHVHHSTRPGALETVDAELPPAGEKILRLLREVTE